MLGLKLNVRVSRPPTFFSGITNATSQNSTSNFSRFHSPRNLPGVLPIHLNTSSLQRNIEKMNNAAVTD